MMETTELQGILIAAAEGTIETVPIVFHQWVVFAALENLIWSAVGYTIAGISARMLYRYAKGEWNVDWFLVCAIGLFPALVTLMSTHSLVTAVKAALFPYAYLIDQLI